MRRENMQVSFDRSAMGGGGSCVPDDASSKISSAVPPARLWLDEAFRQSAIFGRALNVEAPDSKTRSWSLY